MTFSRTFLVFAKVTFLLSFVALVLWIISLFPFRRGPPAPTWLIVLTTVDVILVVANFYRSIRRRSHNCASWFVLIYASLFVALTSVLLCIFWSSIMRLRIRPKTSLEKARVAATVVVLLLTIVQVIHVLVLSAPQPPEVQPPEVVTTFQALAADKNLERDPTAGETFFSAVLNAQANMSFTTASPPSSPQSSSRSQKSAAPLPLSPLAQQCLNEWNDFLGSNLETPAGIFVQAAVFLVEPPTDADRLFDVAQKTLLCFRRLVHGDAPWRAKNTYEGFLVILPTCFKDKTVAGNVNVCEQLLNICTSTRSDVTNVEQLSEEHFGIVEIEVDCMVLVLQHGTSRTVAMVRDWLQQNVLNAATWSDLVEKRLEASSVDEPT